MLLQPILYIMLSLRQSLLNHGGKAYGSMLMSNSPAICELMGQVGYDFLLVDHEHAPTNIDSGQLLLQALYSSGNTEPIVRLPSHDVVYMKKVLDSMRLPGGVLVPMVDTAQMAKEVVASTRYPPAGIRGCAVPFVRGSAWGMNDDYLEQCENDLLVMVQVETEFGVSNIEEIAAVDGIDMIFLGPMDLSASIGKMGQFRDQQVKDLIQEAERKVRDAPTCLLGGFRPPTREASEMFSEGGYSLVAGSADMGLLREAAKQDVKGAGL
jgi:2-keto-3-deoxy-L-rhamnonate aldolase RhmA